MNIVLLGPAGSGKGTLAGYLKRYYHFKTIAMGNLLTDYSQTSDDQLANDIKSYALTGQLVPDHLVNRVLARYISDNMHQLVFDGYPRNLTQAHHLNVMLKHMNQHINLVLVLKITKQAILKRIMARMVCTLCHAVYNLNTPALSPNIANLCDVDQTPLISRPDDQDVTIIEQRLTIYENNHRALIEFYQSQTVVIDIDTEQADVFATLATLINTYHD